MSSRRECYRRIPARRARDDRALAAVGRASTSRVAAMPSSEDVPVVDVFAPSRRASSRRSPVDDARHRALDGRRVSTMRAIVREQRELLEAEQSRADEAEDELQRVLTQADALSRRLDELSGMFASERGREGGLARASPSAASTATATRLQIENERLKRTMQEMEQKHAKEIADLRAARAEGVSKSDPRAESMSADERRRLLSELAEARKEIAIAKEARARALAEVVELRERLEKVSRVDRGAPIPANQPPKTPDWANVDWFAAHAETVAVETETEAKIEPPKKSFEEIDWEAAYADIDATRARVREERASKK